MCLSIDGKYLISGDLNGVIYIWSTKETDVQDEQEQSSGAINSDLITTYDLHKDKGHITNLISINRPLSFFGLTANMKAFETSEVMSLQKFK